jgi:hypothetical protein|nr:hypothetical protein [Neorhizobium tomejilense]
MASFGDAFKAARSAGKTTFKWQGKSYHTKTKDEMEKTKKSVPTPTSRPAQNSGPRSSSVDAENAGSGKAGPRLTPQSSSVSDENADRTPVAQAAAPQSQGSGFRRGLRITEEEAKKRRTGIADVAKKLWRGEAADLF